MNIQRQLFIEQASKLQFHQDDLTTRTKAIGSTHHFFYALRDAAPPWEKSTEQFRFAFLTFFDREKERVEIQAISVKLIDPAVNNKTLHEKDYWPVNGQFPSRDDMMTAVLQERQQQTQKVAEVHQKFAAATAQRQPKQDRRLKGHPRG